MSVTSEIAAKTINLGLKAISKASPVDTDTMADGMIEGGKFLQYAGEKIKGGLTGEEIDAITEDAQKNTLSLMAIAAYVRNILKL